MGLGAFALLWSLFVLVCLVGCGVSPVPVPTTEEPGSRNPTELGEGTEGTGAQAGGGGGGNFGPEGGDEGGGEPAVDDGPDDHLPPEGNGEDGGEGEGAAEGVDRGAEHGDALDADVGEWDEQDAEAPDAESGESNEEDYEARYDEDASASGDREPTAAVPIRRQPDTTP
jgi:hypothetical protein